MNITEDPRLDPQRRRRELRELLRRNDIEAALRLAVEVDHVEAGRIAHRLIQDGAEWSCVDSDGVAWPIMSRWGLDIFCAEPTQTRWLLVCGFRVLLGWTAERALGAAREADTQHKTIIWPPEPFASLEKILRAECYAAGDRVLWAGRDYSEGWDANARDVITPLMLRWMLLPIEEVTS